MTYDWGYFDKIYCISTPEAYIRRCTVREIAEKLNIKIDIRIFKRSPAGSNQGCGESHLSIVKEAYLNNFQRIIIFEDDIIPSFISPSILGGIVQFLKSKTWDLFYFGAVPDCRKDNACTEREGSFYKIRSLCTHAYALNRSIIEKYHDLCDESHDFWIHPIDYIFRDDLELKSYARFPTQFYQETGVNLPQPLINLYLFVVQAYAYYIGTSIFDLKWRLLISTIALYIVLRLGLP